MPEPMPVSLLDYANIALRVYNHDSDSVYLNPSTWTDRTDEVELLMTNSEYFGEGPGSARIGIDLGVGVYTNGNNVVVAFDGWEEVPSVFDPEVINSLKTDDGQVGNFYAKAYYYAQAAIDEYGGIGKNVTFVGHSQGGAFAGLMAAHFGKPAVTFNAQSAVAALPETAQTHNYYVYEGEVFNEGGWYAKSDGGLLTPEHVFTIPAGLNYSSGVNAYRVNFDIAGIGGSQIGNLKEIDLGVDLDIGALNFTPLSYHGMAFVRFIVAVGHDPQIPQDVDAPHEFLIETLHSKLGGELAPLLVDEQLFVGGGSETFLRGIVNDFGQNGPRLEKLKDDLTLIAEYHESLPSHDFSVGLLKLAIQGAAKSLAQSTAVAGVYSSTENAFVVDVADLNFQSFTSIEATVGGAELAVYRDLLWIDTETNEIFSQHRPLFNSYQRAVTDHKALVVSADSQGSNVDMSGKLGAALFFGGAGNDVFLSGSGDDFLTGAGGNDTLNGGTGSNTLFGGSGDDVLLGNAGAGDSDVLVGGSGNDTLSSKAGNDFLYGGAGLDVADYSAHAGGVEIAFGGTSVAPTLKVSGGTAGTDDLFLIEKIIGTAVRDTIKISGEIPSGTAVEIDLGGGQASTVTDVIDLSGASGAMAVQVAANGLGSIQAKDGSGGSITLRNAEVEVIGSAHDDEITLTDVAGTVSGGGGHDLLQGGALDDALSGGEGDDVIRGGGANDTLNGGSGLNSLYGEDGNDILTGGQNTDTLEGGAGDDQLFGGVGHDSLDGERFFLPVRRKRNACWRRCSEWRRERSGELAAMAL